jgi:hypothetical protein
VVSAAGEIVVAVADAAVAEVVSVPHPGDEIDSVLAQAFQPGIQQWSSHGRVRSVYAASSYQV